MKKLAILFTVLFAASTVADAQFYVGGKADFGFKSNKTKQGANTSNPTNTINFSIAPRVGFNLNDKMAVGLDLSYGSEITKAPNDPILTDKKWSNNTIGAGVFFRYYCMSVGGFSIFTEAEGMFSTGTSKFKYHDVLQNINVDPKGYRTNILDISITPGIAFKVNEHFEVDAYLGLFAIDFKHEVRSNEDSSVDDITFENNFGLGVNNGKALAFGFVYNF
ncbi:MAG: outer membrane beta-barrel protein [Bacteroidales bacterium]|nr:outer membrane beta-barrel protein [Bacteroidales bacterium]MBQ5533075.1 outer membrane beta-barrel protein [Bacteroidales bacterium]